MIVIVVIVIVTVVIVRMLWHGWARGDGRALV